MLVRFLLLAAIGGAMAAAAVPVVGLSQFPDAKIDSHEFQKLISPKLNELPKDQFQKMLQKAFSENSRLIMSQPNQLANAREECSIPLLEFKGKNPELNSGAPALPRWNKNLDAMAAPPPVPACKDWNKSK